MAKQKPSLNDADIKLLKRVFITRSSDDVDSINNLITQAVNDAIEEKGLVTKADISHLPTKDEFFTETAKILKGQEDLKDEKDALSSRTSDNSDRIEKLEEIHPDYKHAS